MNRSFFIPLSPRHVNSFFILYAKGPYTSQFVSRLLSDKSMRPNWQIHNQLYSKSTIMTKAKSTDIQPNIPHPHLRLSFQIMTRAEPPALVQATIESLLAIKNPDDEILIIDNNHTDQSLYQPLQAYCEALDPTFKVRFYHEDHISGYKSGALNFALDAMDSDCQYIVVVDSDYQALPWARQRIAQAIKRHPDKALLQFPQYYRDVNKPDVHTELNHYFSYHIRRPFNRHCALSTGTFAVIKKQALDRLGGWSGASITEDAQMGVLMHRQGLQSQFIPEVIATGLLPTSLVDLMAQRRRWIYGNMQVLLNYRLSAFNTCLFHPDGQLESPTMPSWQQMKSLWLSRQSEDAQSQIRYVRAHLSQLSAWVNFTGVFIGLHAAALILLTANRLGYLISIESTALVGLGLCYAGYGGYLSRRLFAYLNDCKPLSVVSPSPPKVEHEGAAEQTTLHKTGLKPPLKATLKILFKRAAQIEPKSVNPLSKPIYAILTKVAQVTREGSEYGRIKTVSQTLNRLNNKLLSATFFSNQLPKSKLSNNNKLSNNKLSSKSLPDRHKFISKLMSTSSNTSDVQHTVTPLQRRIKAWLLHLNFWELGALSWLPVLWGQQKPFVCTPKFNDGKTSFRSKGLAVMALPKSLIVLNIITAILMAGRSPPLFVCALSMLTIKLSAAWIILSNFSGTDSQLQHPKSSAKSTMFSNRTDRSVVGYQPANSKSQITIEDSDQGKLA